MSDQVLLRDLVAIPDEVHAGDFVLGLAQGITEKSTITDYVVTDLLAQDFDRALGVIKSAVETGTSRAAYLDGSFGSGKSHFMAVLYAILKGDPNARGKRRLADVVARHDPWLKDRRFLLVPYHLPDSQSLDAAILGGYVDHVLKEHPGRPLPAVYRDDELIADAKEQRQQLGDDAFIAQLPVAEGDDAEWETANWDSQSLDEAFSEPPGGEQRRKLIGDLLVGPFRRFARAVRADQESFIPLDEGLSVISKHARNVLGYDAVVLLLDELVLWLAGYIGNPTKVSLEAQKVSKLIESAESDRPAPVISFVPRQRDLRDLVSKAAAGNEVTSLFDTLKYWDGRFDHIRLDDRNLPAIVHERLLKPKDENARRQLDAAFEATRITPRDWEVLLNTRGEQGSRDTFRQTYPFSPAFVAAMVDISSALQRERTALKLMQQLLVDYRDTLPVGQLMPLGAIFDVLAQGADRPFTDKLRDEFETAKRFYTTRLRLALLSKHKLTEDQVATLSPKHAFRGDDLVAKTLLLAALVPNVPALNGLTASRLAALNHGSIVSLVPNQQRAEVTKTLKYLSGQFGEIRLSGSEDDLRVDLALIGVDTEGLIRDSRHADDEGARKRLIRAMVWEELGLRDDGAFETQTSVTWRGTQRTVDVLMENVSDTERTPTRRFQADPGTIRMIIDYPFDEGNRFPADDVIRVNDLKDQLGDENTIAWLPHFLSDDRKADLSTLIVINFLLERDRLTEVTPDWTADDRHHARTQLDSRRSALRVRISEAIRRAYGVNSPDDADLGPRAPEQVMTLARGLEPRIQVGQGMKGALRGFCGQLLTHRFPSHPDFDPNGRGVPLKAAELDVVLRAIEQAAQDKVGRYEVPRADVATLKKIANPLKLGVMHEQAFVLSREWPDLLTRKSESAPEVNVGKLRGWIGEQEPGLPDAVHQLVVACYAIQADKAWLRGGQLIDAPQLDKITDDMALRSQELPTPEEFELASSRATGIFRIAREPVRTARSVHALAVKVRQNAHARLAAARDLAVELTGHAATLGLGDESPRMVTARIVTGLLDRLAATTDDTETLRVLAKAELSRDYAFYQAHLENAEAVTSGLRTANWEVLDALAAEEADADAAAILSALRQAARHDEHEVALGGPLRAAGRDALALVMSRAQQASARAAAQETASQGEGTGAPTVGQAQAPQTQVSPLSVVIPDHVQAVGTEGVVAAGTGASAASAPSAPDVPFIRVAARDVARLVERICEEADENPDAEFEIAWRIADS